MEEAILSIVFKKIAVYNARAMRALHDENVAHLARRPPIHKLPKQFGKTVVQNYNEVQEGIKTYQHVKPKLFDQVVFSGLRYLQEQVHGSG